MISFAHQNAIIFDMLEASNELSMVSLTSVCALNWNTNLVAKGHNLKQIDGVERASNFCGVLNIVRCKHSGLHNVGLPCGISVFAIS